LKREALILLILGLFFIGISAGYSSNVTDYSLNVGENNIESSINNITNDIITNDVALNVNSLTVDNESTKKVNNTSNSNSNINTNNSNINTNNSNTNSKTTANNKKAAGELTKLSQSQILQASKTINNYISKNKKLPNYVTISGVKFSMPEYMYLLGMTIYYKYNKKTTQIAIKYNIKNPNSPIGVNIKGSLTKAKYYAYAKNIISYIKKYNQAPNYVNTKLGKMQYQTTINMLNKIVYYSATHKGSLPSKLTLNIGKSNKINKVLPKYTRNTPQTPTTSGISLANIKDAASRVNAFINQNDELPNYVEISSKKYTMANFLYLLSCAITNINSGSSSGINPISVSNPTKPTGNSINGKLSKANFVSLAKNVTNFIKSNKQAPNYANSPLGKIQFQTIVWEFSKIIEYVAKNNKLPSSVTINVKSSSSINSGSNGGSSAKTTVLNDKNTLSESELQKYLKSTKNCQVTNSEIQKLAASITKGCYSDLEKATAIYNWMQKNIDYSFYYDTKYGAVKTSQIGYGNCVDQAHLSIALYRASGLAARYVHGTCTFSSGNVYGHVWVQVLIDDTWTVSDTTSSKNSLGVVNNWNPYTYKLKSGKVAEISF